MSDEVVDFLAAVYDPASGHVRRSTGTISDILRRKLRLAQPTPAARRLLAAAEKLGLVQRSIYRGGGGYFWKLTAAGVDAVLARTGTSEK